MKLAPPLVALAVLLCVAAACSAPRSPSVRDNSVPGNAYVVSGSQLLSSGTNYLLDAMRGRVMNMAVDRQGRCPRVTLRGERTIIGTSNPQVYVDGTPVSDTCVLDVIRVTDVDRIEVYPSGITSRPGYRSSPFGLILVFLTG